MYPVSHPKNSFRHCLGAFILDIQTERTHFAESKRFPEFSAIQLFWYLASNFQMFSKR